MRMYNGTPDLSSDYWDPNSPGKYCDPNSGLVKYYIDLTSKLKAANDAFNRQNILLRSRLRKLETDLFYSSGNHDSVKLLKENKRLKLSLTKLYEKYIKPLKLDHTKREVFLPDVVNGYRYVQRPLTPSEMFNVGDVEKEAVKENNKVWRKLAHKPKEEAKLFTRILFVSDENGHAYDDNFYWLVKVNSIVDNGMLYNAERKQTGLLRSGGSAVQILKDLNLDYELISSGKISTLTKSDYYNIRYDLTSGNY